MDADAGWYLLRSGLPPDPSPLWLFGEALDATGATTSVRVPLHSRHGRIETVVPLSAATRGLHVHGVAGPVAVPFAMTPISRREAVRRMIDGLRYADGRRDWTRLAATFARMLLRAARGQRSMLGAVLVSAYLGRDGRMQPARVRRTLLAGDASLEPIDQLAAIGGNADGYAWEATGEDPKFRFSRDRLPLALPPGWYLFDAGFECMAGQLAAPCLYPDYGPRSARDDAIVLPSPGQGGRVQVVVMLKHPVAQLRFDPTMRRARFRLHDVRLLRLSRARALCLLLQAAAGDDGLPALARSAWGYLDACRKHGVSIATSALHQRYLRKLRAEASSYAGWVRRYDAGDGPGRVLLEARAARVADGPLFSVLLPVYETPEPWLRRCIDSVLAQAYGRWELCIADDASRAPHLRRILLEYANGDPRVRVAFRERNGHISEASNTALAMASGEYIALLDHDDELRPHALLEIAEAIAADPALDLVYSDEDKIDENGRRFDPYFKPDWNPDLLLGQNYVCHLTVLRARVARAAGGFRTGFEGSQDHDLVLRCTRDLPRRAVGHVPRVLYHWRAIPGSTALQRDAKDYAALAGARAVEEHVRHEAAGATVEVLDEGHYRVRWPLPRPVPKVTLVVPTRDRPELLRTCIDSLLGRTEYPDFEIVVVDNQSSDPDALAYLDRLGARAGVRVLRYDAPFNYSAINNFAVAAARGTVIGMVNNDIEVISPHWLQEMVGQAMRPGVGAVGAMLYYPDGRIQHAGVVLGLGGIANHAYAGEPAGIGGHGGRARVVQEVSAVTGACLIVRRDAYERVGGLDEGLQVAFNDIDFCLRLGQAGLRCLWTPFATLYHHESASRGRDEDGPRRQRFLREVALMQERWGHLLERDPAYNPNLTLSGRGFELADPPRA